MKTANALAFDRASVRTYDADNRLHVSLTPISKANVCGYLGSEIPDFETIGLDPDKLYQLYRDPDELAKAAPLFNNLPLLSKHVPVSAESHHPDLVIGSTGTDAVFEAPYLKNSLVIWAKSAIDEVENGTVKELSSAYRYRADMTPGTINGERYDGVMRDIIGNHVAKVSEGRAGPDVVVQDSALNLHKEQAHMAKKLTRRGAALAGINKALGGKLAQDANLADITKLLDALDDTAPAEDAEADTAVTNANADVPPANPKAEDDDLDAMDGEGLSDEEEAQYQALAKRRKPAAADADPEDGDKGNKPAFTKGAADADKDEKKDMVTRPAMDAALAAVKKDMREAAVARETVRPDVGALDLALDSAEMIYRSALSILGCKKAEKIAADGLADLYAAWPKPNAVKPARPAIAQDAAASKSYAEMFPGAARIGQA